LKLKEEIFERIDESLKDAKVPPNEWKLFYRIKRILVRFPRKQPQHVDDDEAEAIKGLREHHNYSISDLAFIFDKSKVTIHAILKKAGLSGDSE
jgi:hypothetical protein